MVLSQAADSSLLVYSLSLTFLLSTDELLMTEHEMPHGVPWIQVWDDSQAIRTSTYPRHPVTSHLVLTLLIIVTRL